MGWRVAQSLNVLLDQINAMSPNRDKSSDGGIGNAEHASRDSDHNPYIKDGAVGIVTARDFTNDPAHGMPSQGLADALVASRDPRIKYVISNRRICSGTGQDHEAWRWRPYSGANPHDHHCHVSVKGDKAHYDDRTGWNLTGFSVSVEHVNAPAVEPIPTLRMGSKGKEVAKLQRLLGIADDGDFGPKTKAAVIAFQIAHKLVPDGVAGLYTWEALV